MLSRVDHLTDQFKLPPAAIVVAGSDGVADEADVRLLARGGLPPRAFRRVREYILAHLADDVSNIVLAGFVGLSPSHFSRAFKQSAGVSPHRFVLQHRIERVKQLLAETELPLAQIAVTAGFGDQSHCSRWFRELVGITPSRFRWMAR
jgi:transcriptional regulator GlxA family with amidase domain